MDAGTTHFSPGDLIARGKPCGVEISAKSLDGHDCLRLALDPARRKGELGRDFGDEPTFLLLPEDRNPLVFEADQRLIPSGSGQVGLWVDIGTEGFLSGVNVR